MFESINLILNEFNRPEYANLHTNQYVRILSDIIETNNIDLKWLFFETFLYLLYSLITGFYNYTLNSLCKPIETIRHIQRFRSTIHFQIYPEDYRYHIYRQLFKTLLFDIIRAIVVFFIYFEIQKMLMWS